MLRSRARHGSWVNRGLRLSYRYVVGARMPLQRSRATLFGLAVAVVTVAACMPSSGLYANAEVQTPASDSKHAASYTLFESGSVRPLALSPSGDLLAVVNTPDARVELFSASGAKIAPQRSVPVGLEPVALAFESNDRLWVVNHLSDSVSIVDLASSSVVRTLWVGDEPRDIVFAGSDRRRAFISTAHRGQNSPVDPALNTPGVPARRPLGVRCRFLGRRSRRDSSLHPLSLRRHSPCARRERGRCASLRGGVPVGGIRRLRSA